MNIRYIIAAVLGIIGFLLIAGAVGSLEQGLIGIGETILRAVLGIALVLVAVPVSGDFERGERK